MRAGGQQLYAGDAYNSVYLAQQQQYGLRPGPGHMGPAAARTDEAVGGGGPGPMKGTGVKATMFPGQQQQQQAQRSAPYPNPHRYMQSRRPQFINGQTPEVQQPTSTQIRTFPLGSYLFTNSPIHIN